MAKKKIEKKDEVKTSKNDRLKNNEMSPITRFNILFVDLQILFTVITIICFIWYLFNAKALYFLQASLGISLIVSGYNNKIIYNKKKMMYVYFILGLGLIILDILMILGV